MVNFNDMISMLAAIGVWDIVLPFMLIFTIVYATLTTTLKSMFGKSDDNDNSKYAMVISFVIGLGVVIPHAIGAYPPGANVVEIINRSLPQVALIAVAILGLMILLGMFGIKTTDFGGQGIMLFIVAASILFIVYIFGSSAGWWSSPSGPLSFLNDPDTMTLVISLLVFGLVVWFITKDSDSGKGVGETIKDIREALFK